MLGRFSHRRTSLINGDPNGARSLSFFFFSHRTHLFRRERRSSGRRSITSRIDFHRGTTPRSTCGSSGSSDLVGFIVFTAPRDPACNVEVKKVSCELCNASLYFSCEAFAVRYSIRLFVASNGKSACCVRIHIPHSTNISLGEAVRSHSRS